MQLHTDTPSTTAIQAAATIPADAAATPTDNPLAEKNHQNLVALLSQTQPPTSADALTMRLDRFVVDRRTQRTVAYRGVASLLNAMAKFWPSCENVEEGLLAGFAGMLDCAGEPVAVRVSLGPAAQLRTTAGPTTNPSALMAALDAVDRQVHVAAAELGLDVALVAQGYNPTVESPLDLPLVPRTSHALMNAYLGKEGRFARDAMRCTAATVVSLPAADVAQKEACWWAAALFSPIAAFLCDNALTMRGENPATAGRMIGARVWREVEGARCGVAAGTIGGGVSDDGPRDSIPNAGDTITDDGAGGTMPGIEAYARWLEGIDPVFLASEEGVVSTDKLSTRQLMRQRILGPGELQSVVSNVMPPVRLRQTIELHCADALPPRQAVAYATFARALLSDPVGVLSLLGNADAHAIESAYAELILNGWQATPYGTPLPNLVMSLVKLAKQGMDARDLDACDCLFQLWESYSVPRDLLMARWRRNRSVL